nr:linker for activation of T-cells family member 2 isoform X2 [Geotrypetes seraphini]
MNQVELLWAVASLMLLGALVTLCMKCTQSKVTQKNRCSEQSNLNEDELRFQVVRSYTMMRHEQKADKSQPRRNTLKCPGTQSYREEPRYLNVTTANGSESDATYIDPITMDYYNCGHFLRPPTDDEAIPSYENIVISSTSKSEPATDDSSDYENAVNIKEWKNSREISGSPENEYSDPDYANTMGIPVI